MRALRVANGQGFWGDSVDAPLELLSGGPVDVIGMDYLAEVTLSIMMRQKLKNPAAGYATDFLDFVRRALPLLVEKGVKVVTNAGGLNPAPAASGCSRSRASSASRGCGSASSRATTCSRACPSWSSAGTRSPTWTRVSRWRRSCRGSPRPTPTSARGQSPRRCAKGRRSSSAAG